ncbi:unnamed protein product [Bemisia tabaci]|uniref:Meckel syndrome type 1 protein n=1 Tax=Bemisia tabaci TaxID=7038 RepID=A0A9P0A949_BEMTA|nr:unnamed protein product [Bemisia tabaci]
MPRKPTPDFQSGIYLSKTPIDKLKIRVVLEMVTTTALEEIKPPSESPDESKEPVQVSKARVSEQKDFSWQKRVYCSREVEFYKKESNCRTQDSKRHHEKIKQILDESDGTVPKSRLYSCVESDEVTSEFDRDLFVDDSRLQSTKLSRDMKCVQTKCPMSFRRRFRDPFRRLSSIVDYNPSKDTQLRNRLIATPTETMYILADLSQNNDKEVENLLYTPADYQYILVSLQWQPLLGTLIILPDFLPDTSNNGYSIKLSHDLMNIEYRYWVQNVSETSLDHQRLSQKLLSMRPRQLGPTVDPTMEFEVPERSTLECFVFVELGTAARFDCDPVFAFYSVHLPPGWRTPEPEALHGATHLCHAANGRAVFSHLLELKLVLDFAALEIDPAECTEYSICHPILYLEVCSLDSWGRYRVLGYGNTHITQSPGMHFVTLNTWRPAPTSIKEKLKYFFIGANKQLAHITYSGIPEPFAGSLMSKYGFETMPSGDITLKINVVHQVNQSSVESTSRKPKHLMGQMSCSSLVNSVNAVLEAFHKARQRMLLAKTPLIEHHLDSNSSYNDEKSADTVDSRSSGEED